MMRGVSFYFAEYLKTYFKNKMKPNKITTY